MTKALPANAHDARELALYAVNSATLYERQGKSIIANLNRKIRRGVYDADLAVRLWAYLAESAAKDYAREFGPASFTPATRRLAAVEIAAHYASELENV